MDGGDNLGGAFGGGYGSLGGGYGDSGFGAGGYGDATGTSSGGFSSDNLGGVFGGGYGSLGNENGTINSGGLFSGINPLGTGYSAGNSVFGGNEYGSLSEGWNPVGGYDFSGFADNSLAAQATQQAALPQASFFDSPFGKVVRTLANFTPIGRVANIGYNLAKGEYGNALGSAIGGVPGGLVGMGVNAAMGQNVGPQAGGFVGSQVGGQVAGPLGAMFGGWAGSQLGKEATSGTSTGTAPSSVNSGNNGMNFGNIMTGLGGLYAASQANKTAQAAQAGQQDLSAMFGPNSAYAQTMRQQLERQDAKAGRRSQYGPREVELQAKLAAMAAQYGSSIGQQNIAAANAAQTARNQQLNMLLQLGQKSGAFDYAQRGLQNLFNQPTQDYSFTPTSYSPSYQSSPEFNQELSDYGVW